MKAQSGMKMLKKAMAPSRSFAKPMTPKNLKKSMPMKAKKSMPVKAKKSMPVKKINSNKLYLA